jgi:hypothetical protein
MLQRVANRTKIMNSFINRRNSTFSPLLLASLALALAAPLFSAYGASKLEDANAASKSKDNEVQVTLLGQPCFLKGPFDKDTLKAIHSIGPAQVPEISISQLPHTKERFQKTLEVVRSARGVPTLLDPYREKMSRRLEAQTELLKALIQFKQNKNIQEVMKTARNYLPEEKLKSFQSILMKKPSSTLSNEALLEAYNDGIEADPEQEFHRIINQKMHIQYACSFDESLESSE